jgi:hypothetical protein
MTENKAEGRSGGDPMSPQFLIPSPSSIFKPRAEAHLLSNLLTAAWQDVNARLSGQAEQDAIAEGVTTHLESLYPFDDMKVLSRYGVTETIESISVRMWNGADRWDESTSVKLARPVVVPTSERGLYVGGQWFSKTTMHGVKPEHRAKMSDDEWAELVKYHADSERRRIPACFETYFAAIVEARQAYRAEYGRCTAWPAKQKEASGAYPAWTMIEAEFPTLGLFIARQRAQ